MPYSNNNSAPFDFSTLDSAKPATYNQIKFRIGNVATAVLFSRLDLNRDNFKSANRKIFTQMASALQTATIEKPLTNADIQAIDATGDVTKYRAIFERAFAELYCTSEELHKLLIKDGLSAKKAGIAAGKYTLLHDDIPVNVETVDAEALEKMQDFDKIIEAKAKAKAKATIAKAKAKPPTAANITKAKAEAKVITARVKAKPPKSRTVEVQTRASLTDDQRADAIATLQQRLDELLAM
tara:strand:- start:83 stop:799 length:717 start_codon:yes stop_codon:yes gene_type:complete